LIKGDLRSVGVIVLSMLSAAERAREAGADVFLMKPIEEDRLVGAVNDIRGTLWSESSQSHERSNECSADIGACQRRQPAG
jgi:DNA-binding NarL/FixJ family response regulator